MDDDDNGKTKDEVLYPTCSCVKDPFGLVGSNEGTCCGFSGSAPLDGTEKYGRNLWILRLNFAAAILHVILFIVLLSLVTTYEIDLTRPLSTKIGVWEKYPNKTVASTCKWDAGCANPVALPPVVGTAADGKFRIYDTSTDYGELSLAPLVLSFSALSAIFQFLRPFVGYGKEDYLGEVERRVNWLRWVEYSFSATTMILAVSFVLNVNSFGTNIMLATSTFATQICGLVGELMLERVKGNYRKDLFVSAWVVHLAGWVLQFGVFITIFVSYFQSAAVAKDVGGEDPPSFVYAIVLSMGLLFGSFGIVQFVDFIHRTCFDRAGEEGCCRQSICCDCGFFLCRGGIVASQAFELTYIALSLTAKALLSILVASNLFLDPEV